MKRLCAFAIVVMGLVLVVPAPAPATDTAQRLEQTRSELAAIRKRLADAKGQAAAIQREVNALDAQISSLSRQIRTGEMNVSSLESAIRSAEAKIAALQQQYADSQRASNQRARLLYISGPAESIGHLIDARSLGEFVRMSVWWSIASELDGKAMIDSARTRKALTEQKEDMAAIKANLGLQKRYLEEQRQLIASARSDKAVALAVVQGVIDREEKNLKQLEAESRALTAELRSRVSRSSGAVSHRGFIWPLRGPITSPFGPRRGGFHPGIDIDGNTGDPIVAAKSGTIVQVSCGSGYGTCTIIDHGGGVSTLYAHQSRKAVTSGSVSQGQVIGYVGCTGSCTGSHLHFEVRVDGEPRDPMQFLP